MAMRRGDRHDDSYDNSLNHPRSHQQEPLSYHELTSKVSTLRADKTELEQKVQTIEVQYKAVLAERDQYITLYNEAQDQLKFERRSKAGIKGWETRRKRENEKLKQEIAEMMVLVRDSLAREEMALNSLEEMADKVSELEHNLGEQTDQADGLRTVKSQLDNELEAITNQLKDRTSRVTELEEIANRMDRIQSLVGSVETDSIDDTNLFQKFKRIWQAIQDILAE